MASGALPVRVDALSQAIERSLINVLCQHAAFGIYSLGQTNGVIPVACANICHGHARGDFSQIHHCFSFAAAIALIFRRKLVGPDF